ncbi:hypothetical protein P4133_05080, partial [Pseudomonas aeruginosa]|nr:hypothetical protein [Pseudomonas aeruginosa]
AAEGISRQHYSFREWAKDRFAPGFAARPSLPPACDDARFTVDFINVTAISRPLDARHCDLRGEALAGADEGTARGYYCWRCCGAIWLSRGHRAVPRLPNARNIAELPPLREDAPRSPLPLPEELSEILSARSASTAGRRRSAAEPEARRYTGTTRRWNRPAYWITDHTPLARQLRQRHHSSLPRADDSRSPTTPPIATKTGAPASHQAHLAASASTRSIGSTRRARRGRRAIRTATPRTSRLG